MTDAANPVPVPVPAPAAGELLALRQGVYSAELSTGETRLLAWPHAESFGPLDAGQHAVLRGLAERARSRPELLPVWRSAAADTDGGERQVEHLLARLRDGGWLEIAATCGGRRLHTLKPRRAPSPRPAAVPGGLVLSRFAVLRRVGDGMVLESPRAWCDVWLHDPAALAVLGTLTSPRQAVPAEGLPDVGLPDGAAGRLLHDLAWAGMAVPAAEEDAELRLAQWSPHELWFHDRSRLGDRGLTGVGGTYWAKGRFDSLPARPEHDRGTAPDADPDADTDAAAGVALYRPDLDELRRTDPTLTTVLEDRRTIRDHDGERPVTAAQLGEFLYRTARTRSTATHDGVDHERRPYPAGGSLYELELYPVVCEVASLDPGMYHYDSHGHRLRPVQAATHPAVRRLVRVAARSYGSSTTPQVLIVVAGRFGRVMWKYEAMAYALILKHVGVLYQTMYCVAAAMGLAPCGLGAGDAGAFTAATGRDPLVECSVGEFVIGSRAAGATPATHPGEVR